MKQEIFGNISEREKDIKSMAATINRLKAALNKILEIAGDNESSIETIGKIEKVAVRALR
jgi:regulator of replication initiation timing